MSDNSFIARNFMSSAPGESRAVSRNSNFGLRLQLQVSKIFGTGSNLKKFLAPAQERFSPLKTKNHCIICTVGLLQKLCLLNRNSNFRLQLRFHQSKLFGSGSNRLLPRLHSPCWKIVSFRLTTSRDNAKPIEEQLFSLAWRSTHTDIAWMCDLLAECLFSPFPVSVPVFQFWHLVWVNTYLCH